jgi:mRNA interferase MazF
MRAIHVARLDKRRPVLVLTRDIVRAHLAYVTVAPITTRVRGLSSEVRLGSANGLDEPCVANCDAIVTVDTADLGEQVGVLLETQEPALSAAIRAAFDLR